MNALRLVLVAAVIVMVGLMAFSYSPSGSYTLTIVFLSSNPTAPNPTEQWTFSVYAQTPHYTNDGRQLANYWTASGWLPTADGARNAYGSIGSRTTISLQPDNYTIQAWQMELSPDGSSVWAVAVGSPVSVNLNGNHLLTFFGNGTGVAIP